MKTCFRFPVLMLAVALLLLPLDVPGYSQGGEEEEIPCSQGCNTGDCWKVNGVCWKAPKITCCSGYGSWASQTGGTKSGSGTIAAKKNSDCTAECTDASHTNNNGQPDSRASCNGMQQTGTWNIDDCHCSSS